MKAILEFDLNDADDVEAHLRCVKSLDMALALDGIWSYIGKIWRDSGDGDAININELKDFIQSILERRDISTDKLIS